MSGGHGLVLGKFYPPHAGHHQLIDAALEQCDRVTVLLAVATVESIPVELRHRWLSERHPDAHVVSCRDDVPIDMDDPAIWDAHVAIWKRAVGEPVDVVFSGERYGVELARRFGARAVTLSRDYGVTGTAVRADPAGHWDHLEPAVRAHLVKRVVVVGAESTGTTTVARELAERHGTVCVPELGRRISLDKLAAGTFDAWSREEFVAVAVGQSLSEDEYARRSGPVMICDTDLLATRIWEERYLGSTSAQVAHVAALRPVPSLYLLTDHEGVPFVQDGVRDGEDIRAWMTGRFEEELARQAAPWVKLTGDHDERIATAARTIDAVLADGWHFAPPL
jgi:NadR type nicotinamide-nucleotide adenylyltransferase